MALGGPSLVLQEKSSRSLGSVSGPAFEVATTRRKVRLYSRVEAREVPCSFLVALGSGALEPVSGFAEVDFRAFSAPVTNAKVELSSGKALIRRERVVLERLFKSLLRMKDSP